jgi:hypothetical protein
VVARQGRKNRQTLVDKENAPLSFPPVLLGWRALLTKQTTLTNMKAFLSCLAIVAVAFAFTGCEKKGDKKGPDKPPTNQPPPPAPPAK